MTSVANLNKAERIAFIDQTLQALYPQTLVPLDHSDPYTLLVAVLLSAQCTDERVNQVTPALFASADTPEQMVTLSVEEIRAIIRPCGLSPKNPKPFTDSAKCSLICMMVKCLLISMRWNNFPVWATRPRAWSWLKRLACRLSPSTPISIDWPSVGA